MTLSPWLLCIQICAGLQLPVPHSWHAARAAPQQLYSNMLICILQLYNPSCRCSMHMQVDTSHCIKQPNNHRDSLLSHIPSCAHTLCWQRQNSISSLQHDAVDTATRVCPTPDRCSHTDPLLQWQLLASTSFSVAAATISKSLADPPSATPSTAPLTQKEVAAHCQARSTLQHMLTHTSH